MAILDHNGKPYSRIPERIKSAPLLSSRRLEVWHGITPERMAALFRSADQGDLAAVSELYSALRRMDSHVFCETGKRVDGILDLEDQLMPASKSGPDNEICDFVRDALLKHPQWADVKAALNLAVMTGISCVEPVWGYGAAGKVIVTSFCRLPISRLTYTGHDGLLLDWPLLLTDEQMTGIQIDPRNIVLHCGNNLAEHPVRQGALRPIAWMVLLKHYSLKDWWRFGESYGIPMRLGKYDQSTSPDDRLSLFEAVRMLGSDGAAVISKDTEIALLEAASSANSGNFYEAQKDCCNSEISKAAVGSTLTADVGKRGGGSNALGQTHSEELQRIKAGDGQRLAGTIMRQLVKPLVLLNYGPLAALPQYKLNLINQEDYEKKAKWFEPLVDRAGFDRNEYYKQYGLTPPEIDADIIGGTGTGPARNTFQPLAAKAKRGQGQETTTQIEEQRQQVLDGLAERSAAAAADEFASNQAMIVAAVRKAKNWQEALDSVSSLYPQLKSAQLSMLLAQAMTAARIYGRKTGQDDAGSRRNT